MNENAGQFRSAPFGGFHRQDVLDYIEKITKAHREEKADLEAQLEKAREESCRQEEKLLELDRRTHGMDDTQEDLTHKLETLTAQLEEKEDALKQAQEQIEELQLQLEILGPEAESWKRIKDTAGDIEVSAHERAQVTVQEARTRAAEIHAEAVRWVLDIQARCDRLQSDLHTSVAAAEAEMEEARLSFAQAEEELQGFQSALSNLVEGVGEKP